MARVIDAHVHLFGQGYLPQRWYEAVAARWSASRLPPVPRTASDVEAGLIDEDASLLVKELRSAAVDAAVCLSLDWGVHLGEPDVSIRTVHRRLGDLQRRFDGTLYGVAGVDPRRPDAADIVRTALEEDGLHGVKLYPPSGFLPGDKSCYPIYELCQSLDRPVVLHTAVIGNPHDPAFANPLGVVAVQRDFPDLTIVLAHAGYPAWGREAIEVAAGHPRTYLELSNWNHELSSPHRAAELTTVLVEMRNTVGAHRMIFGSDHLGGRRFSGGRSGIAKWKSFIAALPAATEFDLRPLTSEEVDLILGGNAVRVFGLS